MEVTENSTVEIQIKDLQNEKAHLLIQLHKLPTNIEQVKRNCDEIKAKINSKDCPNLLLSVNSQRLRLLCKLAFDITELSVDFSKITKEELRLKIRRKHFLEGDKFWTNNFPIHPLLKNWHSEILKSCKHPGKLDTKLPHEIAVSNKEFYNIKYEPFCSRCKEDIGMVDLHDIAYKSFIRRNTALLSFSTRHNGYCCNCVLESNCMLCFVGSDTSNHGTGEGDSVTAKNFVRLKLDPWFSEDDQFKLEDCLQQLTACNLVKKHIWPCIDKIVNLDFSLGKS